MCFSLRSDPAVIIVIHTQFCSKVQSDCSIVSVCAPDTHLRVQNTHYSHHKINFSGKTRLFIPCKMCRFVCPQHSWWIQRYCEDILAGLLLKRKCWFCSFSCKCCSCIAVITEFKVFPAGWSRFSSPLRQILLTHQTKPDCN